MSAENSICQRRKRKEEEDFKDCDFETLMKGVSVVSGQGPQSLLFSQTWGQARTETNELLVSSQIL